MNRYHSYLEVAKQVIAGYKGDFPFSMQLKKFFSGKKKFGSTDRKIIASLCYSFFRAGHAIDGDLNEKIIRAFFLCISQPHPFLQAMNEALNENASLPAQDKLKLLGLRVSKLFPREKHLSPQVDTQEFCISLLHQPRLFLRVRPGKGPRLVERLKEAEAEFDIPEANVLSFPNATKLGGLVAMNKEAVIQDMSSQKTLDFLNRGLFNSLPIDVWDCCAASGGKSILAYDRLEGKMRLSVTDIRPRVLNNLTLRLAEAGVPVYDSRVADLSKPVGDLGKFMLVICDAPCTGSGTWSREPEQMHYQKEDAISSYAQLQKKIILNSIAHLQPGGIFVYITCSVFSEENERQVEFISVQPGMKIISAEYILGYGKGADTLFTSAFRLSV